MTLIALTGVTGHLGGQVAKLLERKNLNLRYLARRPEKAPKVAGVPVFSRPMTGLKRPWKLLVVWMCSLWFQLVRVLIV